MIAIAEKTVSQILTRSKLPGASFCINPYIGCSHRCLYCYARFMRRFTGHSEAWGTFIDVKINAPKLIRDDLRRVKRRGEVLIGSVCDAYQGVERTYKITRAIITELHAAQFPFSILTKSDLVLRDIDLLSKANCTVGFSIATLDDTVRRHFEPGAPSIARRLEALRTLHAAGISTYVFIGPILPGLTNPEAIIAECASMVDNVWAETLNLRCGIRQAMEAIYATHYPDAIPSEHLMSLSTNEWHQLKSTITATCQRMDLPLQGIFQHHESEVGQ